MKKFFSSKKIIIPAKIGIYSVLLLIVVIFTLRVFADWSEPTAAPTNNNTSAPLNVSATTQTIGNGSTDIKSIVGNLNLSGTLGVGGIGVIGILRGYSNAIFDGNVGIGGWDDESGIKTFYRIWTK